MLFFKMHSANSIGKSVKTVLSSYTFNIFRIANNPSSWGILGYRPKASIVYKTISSCKEGRTSNSCKTSRVTLIYYWPFCAISLRYYSGKPHIFSVWYPDLDITWLSDTLASLLCIFGRKQNFPNFRLLT